MSFPPLSSSANRADDFCFGKVEPTQGEDPPLLPRTTEPFAEIRNLAPAAAPETLYALYFRDAGGGGELRFVDDNTKKKILPTGQRAFFAMRDQFRTTAHKVLKKTESTPSRDHAFAGFTAPVDGWDHTAVEAEIANHLAAPSAPPQTFSVLPDVDIAPRRAEAEPAPDRLDLDSRPSIVRHLMRLGAPPPEESTHPSASAMFGRRGPHLHAILSRLNDVAQQMKSVLPARYAAMAQPLSAATLQDRMVSAVMDHHRRYATPETAASCSVPLRAVETALHQAFRLSRKAAVTARKNLEAADRARLPDPGGTGAAGAETLAQARREAELTQAYCDYLRDLKRYVTTQCAPYHFQLAGLETAARFGPAPRMDDGQTSTSTIGVAGGGKINAIFSATAAIDSVGNTTDFIDIDGDRNHIRVNGVKVGFSLKEGFDKILSLYASQSVSAQYTNGRYLAHSNPASHFHAVYQNYIQHPRRTAMQERFMRWLIDRSADPDKQRLRISTDRFFSELQRFLTGVESLGSSDAVPRYASKAKLGVGRNAHGLHQQAKLIDQLRARTGHATDAAGLLAITAAAIPLRRDEMKSVFGHLDAAEQAGSAQAAIDALAEACTVIDGLIKTPDVPPAPGGANRAGATEQDSTYWATVRVGATLAGGVGVATGPFQKALAAFRALTQDEQKKTEKPKPPGFNPTLDVKLETEASFRKGRLQRLNVDPYRALSPAYLASQAVLLKTMNDVRSTLASASPDAEHPYLAYLNSFDTFADLRRLHPDRHPPPAGVHPHDAWLRRALDRGRLHPTDAAQRLTTAYARAARQMASFMAIESGALHSAPGSAESQKALALINAAVWQGRHTIDPASATREEIDAFLGLTRGLIALACSEIDKNAALATDAAARRLHEFSAEARRAFDNARERNAAYAAFLSLCFAKSNDLGNEHHARHATVLQPGPSNRDDFSVTMTLPSIRLPALDTAVPSDSTLAKALVPVTDNLAPLAGASFTYQSSVFDHPAPLPRAGTGTTYTVAGKASFLLGGQLPALMHAVNTGRISAKVHQKNDASGKLANHLLDHFADQPDFQSDFGVVFQQELDRTRLPDGKSSKAFHALTGSQTSGVTVRKFRHPGTGQPSLVRDLTWWMDRKGGVTVMPEFLAYAQPGATLKAGGSLSGVRHTTLAHRLGNDPFFNSMNFVKTGGLNARLERSPAGRVDLARMQGMFAEMDEACRTWFSGATPGSLGAIVDNFDQLQDYVQHGGTMQRVPGNPLDALRHRDWADIVENAHRWSRRDPRNLTRLEDLDAPGPLQSLFEKVRSAEPLAPAHRLAMRTMSAQQRMAFLVEQRPDILHATFDLYTALDTTNGLVKNVRGYGPALNTFFG